MSKISIPHLVSLALALVLVACGDNGQDVKMDVSNIAGDETISLRIDNKTTISFDQIFLVPAGSRSWGPNQLSEELTPGDSWTLRSIPCDDMYDFKAIGDGNVVIETLEVFLECGSQPLISLVKK